MEIGIIIIFHNNEKNINKELFIRQINEIQKIKFCLVNNCSKDKTYQLLKEVKKESESDISIVDIKKLVSKSSAKRAGARFMFNKYELNHIGYINTKSLDLTNDGFSNVIKIICDHQKEILEYNIENLNKKEVRPTLFQSLFSVIEYIKSIKLESQSLNLEYKLK